MKIQNTKYKKYKFSVKRRKSTRETMYNMINIISTSASNP